MPGRSLPTLAESGAPYTCESFVGRVGVWSKGKTIIRIAFIPEELSVRAPKTQEEKYVMSQLARYFDNPRHRFSNLALLPARTDLQKALRRFLLTTSAGELMTYATVARMLNTGARAIGGACSANPYPILVPCHRVISANGLGGYTGLGDTRENLAIKRQLIAHETNGLRSLVISAKRLPAPHNLTV